MSSSASSVAASSPKRKPRISFAIATAFGLGYIPKAPGTFGSLAGVALALFSPYVLVRLAILAVGGSLPLFPSRGTNTYEWELIFDSRNLELVLLLVVALVGVWTASRVASYLASKDPQIIVIDEVSGQYLALWIGSLWPGHFEASRILDKSHSFGTFLWFPLNWKCVLAGFILFRVFDIWKPFPARQAESLPRGWGIMADDWIAGLYAALGLWALRAAGL